MPHVFEGKPRGQSALEFLATYAFVFITISIVLLLLFAFSSIPKNILPTQCSFYSGFQCLDAALVVNASGVPELIVIASDSEPGVVNVSSFSAFLNYHSSKSGYCVPRVATAGEKIYCIANFTGSVTLGSVYTGTFKVIANYCANSPANITAFCPAGSTYTYGGNIRVQATKQVLGTPYYLNIKITNSQVSAVPSHFQQEIQFSPSTYAREEAPDLGNIRFYFGSKELYSWCESGCSSASSNAIFWVKLPQAIPPGQSMVIQMYFLPKNVEYSGVHAGEAPQLSPTYGEYDNGASVFNVYQNFAGSSCPSGWICQSGVTISNGATINNANITSTNEYYPQIFDAYVTSTSSCAKGEQIDYLMNGQNLALNNNQPYWGHGNIGSEVNGAYTVNTNPPDYTGSYIQSLGWSGGTLYWWSNYTNEYTEGTSLSSSSPYYLQIRGWPSGYPAVIQWARTRIYPPNGVMPSVSFGTLTPA